MFCKNCGCELRVNAKFCHNCGTPINVNCSSNSFITDEGTDCTVNNKNNSTETTNTNHTFQPKAPSFLSGAIIAVICFLIIVIFYLCSSYSTGSNEKIPQDSPIQYIGWTVSELEAELGNYTAQLYEDAPGAILLFSDYPCYAFQYCQENGCQADFPFSDSDVIYAVVAYNNIPEEFYYDIQVGDTLEDVEQKTGKEIFYDETSDQYSLDLNTKLPITITLQMENDKLISARAWHLFG